MSLRQNRGLPVDPLSGLNDPALVFKGPVLEFMRELVNAVRYSLQGVVKRDQATSHIILVSPNGTAYRVTVDDAGVITTVNARA